MLFDTSSPGRKRGVQITFGLLALLMAVGFVGFNVGGDGQGGGIAEGLIGQQNTATDTAERDIEAAEKTLETDPDNEQALARLARGRLALANAVAFDPATGAVVEDGGQQLVDEAEQAWERYLAAGPKEPNASVAIQYASFFASPGVADYEKAVRAMQAVLVSREPSSGLYSQLAVYAMAAQDEETAKQARSRALALAGSDQRRDQIRKELDQIQKSVDEQVKAFEEQQQSEGGADAAPGDKGGNQLQPTLPSLQQ